MLSCGEIIPPENEGEVVMIEEFEEPKPQKKRAQVKSKYPEIYKLYKEGVRKNLINSADQNITAAEFRLKILELDKSLDFIENVEIFESKLEAVVASYTYNTVVEIDSNKVYYIIKIK